MKRLDPEEQKRILTEIARTSTSDAARISAIRLLRELQADDPAVPKGFDELDERAELRAV